MSITKKTVAVSIILSSLLSHSLTIPSEEITSSPFYKRIFSSIHNIASREIDIIKTGLRLTFAPTVRKSATEDEIVMFKAFKQQATIGSISGGVITLLALGTPSGYVLVKNRGKITGHIKNLFGKKVSTGRPFNPNKFNRNPKPTSDTAKTSDEDDDFGLGILFGEESTTDETEVNPSTGQSTEEDTTIETQGATKGTNGSSDQQDVVTSSAAQPIKTVEQQVNNSEVVTSSGNITDDNSIVTNPAVEDPAQISLPESDDELERVTPDKVPSDVLDETFTSAAQPKNNDSTNTEIETREDAKKANIPCAISQLDLSNASDNSLHFDTLEKKNASSKEQPKSSTGGMPTTPVSQARQMFRHGLGSKYVPRMEAGKQ